MKYLKSVALGLAFLMGGMLQAQTFSETLTEEINFSGNSSDNLLVVYNVNGSVHVEGYSGNTVKVEVKKSIKGQNKRSLEQGKVEVGVKVEKRDNIIYVYHDSPYTEFNLSTGRFSHKNSWNNIKYEYTMDYTIKVPNKAGLELSTINNGDLVVRNVNTNEISVSNINGAISMENVSGKTYANALNGNIDISYTQNPDGDSTYKSLNGDITILVKPNLNADVSFKSLNGDIYTNFDTKSSPSKATVGKKKGKRGTKYKVNKKTQFQIGNGGVHLDFDVLNGDVTIKS